jgi:phosphoribosylaminoimidazolecarboxamide formyltransferase / IMP cyclohydrolase
MPSVYRIRRALLSVSDKADLVPFAKALVARNVTIISTGGTAKALAAAGVPVTPVERVTGFPEGLDGRVKTLHPAVHGGLLALRDHPEHAAFLKTHAIEPIDLVCINLYPFQETVSKPDVAFADAIENIDVGGPAMLRAAAKNHAFVTVVTSPKDYDRVVNDMDALGGATSPVLRAELAAAAFARTAEYDAAIAAFLTRRGATAQEPAFPQVLRLTYTRVDTLRYGENPHQEAALYRDPASTGATVVASQQLHGKQLSFNNINDAAWAQEACKGLARAARSGSSAVVVKHTNPSGGAVAQRLADAVDAAIAGDPVAAYGGILAVSSPVDADAAKVIAREAHFFEVVVAPAFDEPALAILRDRWTGVRLLAAGDKPGSHTRKLEYRSVPGGMLVQDRDVHPTDPSLWRHAAGPAPAPDTLADAGVLEALVRYVTSNAVILGGRPRAGGSFPTLPAGTVALFGVGSGQVDRVSACRLAVGKAGQHAQGAIAVGDAFFPFADGPQVLIEAGVKTIVHPGGSKRDQDTFDLCNRHGITCIVTGTRHFRH